VQLIVQSRRRPGTNWCAGRCAHEYPTTGGNEWQCATHA